VHVPDVPLNGIPNNISLELDEASELNQHSATIGCVVACAISDLYKRYKKDGAENKMAYPVFNPNSRNNLEKSLAQTHTVMAGKAYNRLLKLPNTR
jgi:ferredoxin-fold anticodon binding domain-containing protein